MLALVSIALLTAASPRLSEAIVVSSNHPLPGSEYDTLRYADDDAIRFTELFDELGIRTTLLTVPDAETLERYPNITERALRPTRAELLRVLADVAERFEAAPDRTRELYFVFSGHGSVTASSAYLHLFDEPFSRTDVFDRILRVIPAERIHIIIDSCHSYFLVNARGERVAAATDTDDLDRYPHVGLMLSTSDRREVQEWDGYRAGVFSYQVLGAMRGAADVDRDGVVGYAEAHGYVMAANFDVTNPSARIRPFVRRPAAGGDSLLDLRVVPDVAQTAIGGELAGHFWVVDEERGRVLDAHKPGDHALVLVLPAERPLYVRRGEEHWRIVTSTTGDRAALRQAPELVAAVTKGSPADEFRNKLFRTPLSIDFVRGLSSVTDRAIDRVVVETPPEWYEDPVGVALLAGGTAALLTAAVSTGVFVDVRATAGGSLVRAEGETDDALSARIKSQRAAADRAPVWQGVMIGSYAVAASLFAGALLRYTFDVDEDTAIAIAPGAGSIAIGGAF